MADPTTLFDLYSVLLVVGQLAMIPAVVVALIRILGRAGPSRRWIRYGLFSSLATVVVGAVALGLHWLSGHRPNALAPMGTLEVFAEHPAPVMMVVMGAALWVYHRLS